MIDTDFPLYGKQCTLKTPYRGYSRGTIVGMTTIGYSLTPKYFVELSSGKIINCHEEEFELDN